MVSSLPAKICTLGSRVEIDEGYSTVTAKALEEAKRGRAAKLNFYTRRGRRRPGAVVINRSKIPFDASWAL